MDSDDDGEEDPNPYEDTNLELHQTVTIETVVSRQRVETLIVVVEVLCLFGLVVICSSILVTGLWGEHGRTAALAALVAWSYISMLACWRLVSTHMRWTSMPRIWNHTASLYCVQWLLTAVLFRTVLIHSVSRKSEELVIAKFVFVTILAVVALTTRRGNQNITLTHEDGVQPSPEPLSSLLSLMTFGWLDTLIWKGYKRPLKIEDVWNVLPEETAFKVLDDFRQVKRSMRLALRLIRFFAPSLLVQQFWAVVTSVLTFIPPLLVKAVLEHVQDPNDVPPSAAWLYVILLPIVIMGNGIADGQALWRGRKICIMLRAIMVGEVYSKTLRRKAASSADTDMNAEEKKPADKKGAGKRRSFLERMTGFKRKAEHQEDDNALQETHASGDSKDAAELSELTRDTQVNSGTIINLMSVDSFKVAEISAYWHFLIPMVPVQLAIAITLLFNLLGWSALAGLAVMGGVLPLNIYFSAQFSKAYKKIMAATDARIHTTNELLQNIRIVKYFAWEERFSKIVHVKREIELAAIARKYILWTLAASLWYAVPVMITGFTFLIYTVVERKPLYPSIAFTALSLFSLLRYPLDKLADMIAHVLESKASVERVEKFLNEEETLKYDQLVPCAHSSRDGFIGFKKANFTWAYSGISSKHDNTSFRLINLDIGFHVGGLNVIAGPTGSGKTSLLMALLGEMTLLNGSVHLPGGYNRRMLEASDDGLTESVAYCAQQAWLINDTIKQNIIFAAPLDEQRYRNVLEACALNRDLEVLENSDATLVGEKGIVVSGGQKQRISLARALYSNSRHVLLDDCLSAVDSHTAQHLYERCISGPLMFGRTCILVTHNVSLCIPHAHHVVVLRNGKIAAQGSPEAVAATGALGDEALKPPTTSHTGSTRVASSANLTHMSAEETANGTANGSPNGHGDGKPAKPAEDVLDANIRTEEKAEGSVDWRIIHLYLSSMGPWYFWLTMFVGYVLDNVANVSTNLWIREWSNSFHFSKQAAIIAARQTAASAFDTQAWVAPVRQVMIFARQAPATVQVAVTEVFPENSYYLGIYGLLATIYILVALSRLAIIFRGSLNAARTIHRMLLEAVLRAKFKFFDTTPLGQITNRFSKDLQAVDQEIVIVASSMLQSLFGLLAIIILITVITPGFLVAGLLLTCIYIAVGSFYVKSSRDLKRLESVQRSPLYQQFGETLSGVVTIRAYGDERRFIEDNAHRINKHNRPFIFLWAANRWLGLRVEFAGAWVSFFAAAFILWNVGTIDAGAAGLSLTYALGFNENILWLVRLYSENEQNMNHVERVKAFLDVEQEAPQRILETQPPPDWPSRGAVTFERYTTRYRPDLEPVLRNLDFKVSGGEKVGIVGRTGAGKSSLAMALFRGLEADAGRILIDGIDIGTIGLQDLRTNLTIVPQDPTLFAGTIRSNLDPFDVFTDDEIFAALRQVNLIGGKGEPMPPADTRQMDSTRAQIDAAFESAEAQSAHPLTDPETQCSLPFVVDAVPTAPPADEHLAPAPPPITLTVTQSSAATGAVDRVDTNQPENANTFTNLASPVAEAGNNLSQGQRQLLCLARALLAAPRVLIMDEATASIDYTTDARIQAALRRLRGRTLFTIAHRLRTIIDYDQVLVLDRGCVAEFAPPWELIEREGGIFRSMCETSGEFEALAEGARVAEANKKLVDFAGCT